MFNVLKNMKFYDIKFTEWVNIIVFVCIFIMIFYNNNLIKNSLLLRIEFYGISWECFGSLGCYFWLSFVVSVGLDFKKIDLLKDNWVCL